MQIFVITFIVFAVAVLAMAVGVLLGRHSIKGSCGGLNSIQGLEGACEACTEPCEQKKKALRKRDAAT